MRMGKRAAARSRGQRLGRPRLAAEVIERARTGHREAKSVRRYAQLHPSALVVALDRRNARKPSR